jgi:UDP-GlcNAc:undecaprenyl-phosphate GlcNAc-1-phosphate transferase
VGLIDDFLHIKPYQKLIGQLMGAAVVVYFGLVLPWTGSSVINMMLTFFWLVGITNAINMLDNMDGLAAGVAAIAAVFLGVNFFLNGQVAQSLMLAGFASALLGFLVYNRNPASIFMGDGGSMFIGFFLASSALLASSAGGGRSRSVLAVLAVPVLVLCIPIFDTTLVTLMRKLAGRPASQGGRDHTSHRLVALGLSEKHAVWMLYAFALSAGALALLVRTTRLDVSLAAIAAFTIVLTLVGIYLGRVRVYDEAEIAAAKEKPLVALLVDLSYKRRVFEVALDLVLIVLAYYSAYALLFGPARDSGDWQLFLRTLPAVVFIKLATFLATGVYRGMWKYASVANVIDFVRAVAISSVLTILTILFAFRFEGFSRTVFVLDGMLLLSFVTASRFAFRFMRRLLPASHARTGKRVAIYGAGDGGELLIRELQNNHDLQYLPVAFLDDDPHKKGKLIHGLPVHAGVNLAAVGQRLQIEEVLLSTTKLTPARVAEVVGACAMIGIPVKRVGLHFEPISAAELGWVMPSAEEAPRVSVPPSPLLGVPEPTLVSAKPHSAEH